MARVLASPALDALVTWGGTSWLAVQVDKSQASDRLTELLQERHRAACGIEAARVREVRRRIETRSFRHQRRIRVAVAAGQRISDAFELAGYDAECAGRLASPMRRAIRAAVGAASNDDPGETSVERSASESDRQAARGSSGHPRAASRRES